MHLLVLTTRARPCTMRTRLFRLIKTQNGALLTPQPANRSFADPSLLLSYVEKTPRKFLFGPSLGKNPWYSSLIVKHCNSIMQLELAL
jgi:hypothetical protein